MKLQAIRIPEISQGVHGMFVITHSITCISAISLVTTVTTNILARLWEVITKHTTSWTNTNKSSSPTYTEQTKNATIWTNKDKSNLP